MAYYTAVPNGESYLGATMHDSQECPAAPGVVRRVGEASVDSHADEVDWCTACFEADDSGGSKADAVASLADQIDAGTCPWCDDYDGDHVGAHASSAHPDKWAEYKAD